MLLCAFLLVACSTQDATPTGLALPSPRPASTPTTAVTPSFTPQRVSFTAGATSVTLTAQLTRDTAAAYVLYVLQGQTMTVRVAPQANIAILDATGTTLTSASDAVLIQTPRSGDYTVVVSGENAVTVTINIPPP